MSELANFLPAIGTPPSSGGGSFKTATISVTGTANIGDNIFVAGDGSMHPEPALRAYNHLVAKASTVYTTSLSTALTRQANTRYNYLPLDPNADFSVYYPSWIGSANSGTPNVNDFHGTEMYSCKLSGGSWFVITGFGMEARTLGPYTSGAYSVNIISSDGTQLSNSTLFPDNSLNVSHGSGGYNKIVAIVPTGSNTVKVYNWSLDLAGSTAYFTVTLFTWNGTTVTKGTPTIISTQWSVNATPNIPPVVTNPVIKYNSKTYVLACYNPNALMLVDVGTDGIIFLDYGATRFAAGQVLTCVMAGTSVHVYQQNYSSYLNISVIDLVTNTAKTSGLAAHLTSTTEKLGGVIVRLDSTTYCYHRFNTNELVTVRTSANGFTTVTTTVTPLTAGILGATSVSGTVYLRTASGLGTSAGKSSAQGSLTLQKLQYTSGTASCTLTPVTDKAAALFDLQDGLSIQGSTANTATDLLACKYIVPLATDTGRATNNQGSLILQVFSPYHYFKYLPTLLGKATTSGSNITVLLEDSVQTLSGAAQGVFVSENVVGIAAGMAIRLSNTPQIIIKAKQISSSGAGDYEAGIGQKGSCGNYLSLSDMVHGFLLAIGGVEGGNKYALSYRERSYKGNQQVTTFFACNGRVSAYTAKYTATSTLSGYSISNYIDAQYTWPIILGTTVSGGFVDNPSPNVIYGYLREDLS